MLPSLLVFVLASLPLQSQTPPPIKVKETVIVSARDAKTIADAVESLRHSRDPLVAQTVADNIVKLTDSMAASRRVNEIGPLTLDEQGVIAVRDLMEKYSFPGGPILVRPRNADSSPGPRLFNFTQSAFIAMCADMASNPLLQFREVQENKMIVVARMVADLNEQQRHEVISEHSTLDGVLKGFDTQDPDGVIIGRVQDIADALAVNADQNPPYDLVGARQKDAFRTLAHMEKGVFVVVAKPQIRQVNVAYEGETYATTVDHFVWFFLRFLLADPSVGAPATLAQRMRLGSDLLDHLTDQLQARVIESVIATLAVPSADAGKELVLGDFWARGPGLAGVKHAPGLSTMDSARGADYKTLVVSAKEMQRRPELHDWLAHELAKHSPARTPERL